MSGTFIDPAAPESGSPLGTTIARMCCADFQIAALIFLACSIATSALYISITRSEGAAVPLSEPLKAGSFDYNLKSPSGCIGTLHTALHDTPDSVLMNADGDIRVSFGNRVIPVRLSMEANFNALGQLGGSFVKIRAENVDLAIGSININPITIRVKATVGGRAFAYDATLPVTVDLRRNRNGTVRPYYTRQPGLGDGYSNLLAQPMLRDLRFSVEQQKNEADVCSGTAALDLTAAIVKLMTLAGEVTKTMQPILPGGF